MSLFLIGQTFAQDWPNLKRYQEENSQLATPENDEKRVVFMGNSITEGWLNLRPSFFEGKPYINRGISGQTTPQMLLRFRQDVIDLNPSLVIILAGINDIAGNTGPSTLEMIMDNIKSMAELADANGIEVVLCSVLPANHFPWREGMKPAPKVVMLNQMIKDYSDDNDIVYVDYFSAMSDEMNGLRKDLGEDGVHPNEEGYKIMEPLAADAISEALERKKKN